MVETVSGTSTDGTPAPADHASVYVQTSRPGHRAPHAWLADGRSTLDLFGKGFVLLRLGAEAPDATPLVRAAAGPGLPLRVVVPQEGALYSTLNASVVKGAPHPNAARLFLNFLLEDEGQRAITGLGSLGTTGVVSHDAPPDVQALLRAKLWGSSNPDDQTRMNALAAEIYK